MRFRPHGYKYRHPHSLMTVFYQVELIQNGGLVAIINGDYLGFEDLPGQWRSPILDALPWQ